MNADVKSVLWNVVGGVLVALITSAFAWLRHTLRLYHLQRLIGFSFRPGTEIRITYGQFFLPHQADAEGNPITHPYRKLPRGEGAPLVHESYSIEHPVSGGEVRASAYVASLMGLSRSIRQLLVSDTNVDVLLDSNFVALGGPGSNYKTEDVLASPANVFIPHNGFALPDQAHFADGNTDYGCILRIRPSEFPQRSWIVCAGLGEWGTSGSAWYLANRWRNLIKSIHPLAYRSGFMRVPDFLAVVRVLRGQDQSARIEAIYRNVSGQSQRVI